MQQHTCINTPLFIPKTRLPLNATVQFLFLSLQQISHHIAFTTNKKTTPQQLGICPASGIHLPPQPFNPKTGHSSSVRRTIRKADRSRPFSNRRKAATRARAHHNESSTSFLYTERGEDVEGEKGARGSEGDPESRAGSGRQGGGHVRGDARIV